MNNSIHAIILAGGKGARMGGNLPKVLHRIRGVSMLTRVLDAVAPLTSGTPVMDGVQVVIGYCADAVRSEVGGRAECVLQEPQLGTGHAVRCALEALTEDKPTTLVLLGDMPLVSTSTLAGFLARHNEAGATLTLGTLVAPSFEPPFTAFASYGRIVRDEHGALLRIVEVKDATEEECTLREVNTSIYCFDTAWLRSRIHTLTAHNAQGEYYLTDTVALAVSEGALTATYRLENPVEALGANTPADLAALEALSKQTEEAGTPAQVPNTSFNQAT